MSDDLIVGLFRKITPAGTAPAYHAANAKRARAQMNARYRKRLSTMFDNDVVDAAAADTPFGAAAKREAARRGLAV